MRIDDARAPIRLELAEPSRRGEGRAGGRDGADAGGARPPAAVRAELTVELYVDDAGFVRGPAPLVYRRLTHLAAWPDWWPGARIRPAGASVPGEAWLVEFTGARGRRLRYEVRPHGWRHEHGFLLALRGDVTGSGEFWLEPTHGGTVVHHLLVATTDLPRPVRVLADHRRAVRRGLWGLKDAIQLEARTSIGLTP